VAGGYVIITPVPRVVVVLLLPPFIAALIARATRGLYMLRVAIVGNDGYKPKSHISSLIRHRLPQGSIVITHKDWDGMDNVVRAVDKQPGPVAVVRDTAAAALDDAQVAVAFCPTLDHPVYALVHERYPDLCAYWTVRPESYKWWSEAIKRVLQQYIKYGVPGRRLLSA
jgi:hypothetical protein